MTRPKKTLVAVKDVWKKFLHEGREVVVLKGIDLVIEEGEMLAVVGPSGAGKSTLLHILGTLDLPTAGSIEYAGQDVTRLSPSRLASFRNGTLGFVFQFHHLLPEFTALENVMMPGLIRGGNKAALQKRAASLLDDVGLSHRTSHRPGELSGGEQQRVALARALVLEPKLILADEPTGNLDSKTSEAIHRLFIELNQTLGTTFLIVTHSGDLADRMPRKVSMRDGSIETDFRRDSSSAAEAPSDGADGPSEEGEASGDRAPSDVSADGSIVAGASDSDEAEEDPVSPPAEEPAEEPRPVSPGEA